MLPGFAIAFNSLWFEIEKSGVVVIMIYLHQAFDCRYSKYFIRSRRLPEYRNQLLIQSQVVNQILVNLQGQWIPEYHDRCLLDLTRVNQIYIDLIDCTNSRIQLVTVDGRRLARPALVAVFLTYSDIHTGFTENKDQICLCGLTQVRKLARIIGRKTHLMQLHGFEKVWIIWVLHFDGVKALVFLADDGYEKASLLREAETIGGCGEINTLVGPKGIRLRTIDVFVLD